MQVVYNIWQPIYSITCITFYNKNLKFLVYLLYENSLFTLIFPYLIHLYLVCFYSFNRVEVIKNQKWVA